MIGHELWPSTTLGLKSYFHCLEQQDLGRTSCMHTQHAPNVVTPNHPCLPLCGHLPPYPSPLARTIIPTRTLQTCLSHSLVYKTGLLLGTEAPVMTPNGVDFSFLQDRAQALTSIPFSAQLLPGRPGRSQTPVERQMLPCAHSPAQMRSALMVSLV